MKIKVKDTVYDSGKITRKKYKLYNDAQKKILEKDRLGLSYTDEDLDLMVDTIAGLYDHQFTADDINDDFEISDIIFEFMGCDIDIQKKLNKKIDSVTKSFMKGKKSKN